MQSNTILGLFIGQNVITLQSVGSTNEYLKGELSKSTPFAEGTAIMAVEQTAGRGQQGAKWETAAGENLTFSVLLKPVFLLPTHQFRLTVAISLAIAEWLGSLLPVEVKIKWPNDLYVGNKKIGGILIENILKGNTWKAAIIGIGVNVNQVVFPDQIRHRVSSIKQILQKDNDIPGLLSDLCFYLDQEYAALRNGQHATQLTRYRQKLYRYGELHPFLIDGIQVDGVLRGVTDGGRLQLDFNGHVVDFDIKEVAFVI